jgi:hypothetical protein
MEFKKSKIILAMAFIAVALSACVRVGDMEFIDKSIELEGADSVAVRLKMGTGEIRVNGGADNLMDGTFEYNVPRWEPYIHYNVSGDRGRLDVRQGRSSGIPFGRAKNRWNISLQENVPLDIEVDFGAGEGKLDFSSIKLRSLNIDMGVGDLTVDLTGPYDKNVDVNIDGGIGSTTVYLPEDIGVRVRVDKGIGSVDAWGLNKDGRTYTNDAYGSSDVTMKIEIDAGIGSIDLRVK